MGVEALDDRYLIITARAKNSQNAGRVFNAPSLVYDYQNDEIVQKFSSNGQTVSVALLDDDSRVLIGAGGQAHWTGQPNLLFETTYKEQTRHLRGRQGRSPTLFAHDRNVDTKQIEDGMVLSLVLSDPQLVPKMPLDYTIYERVDSTPAKNQKYSPGKTRTRQVLSFGIDNGSVDNTDAADLVLEINSAQTCNIFHRATRNDMAKVFQLPGSEGVNTDNEMYYARAGDTLVVEDQVYIILAQYNGNNTVYSFSTDIF